MPIPYEVADFIALPVTLRATSAYPKNVKHYIYIKRHEPHVAEESATRSLFLVNVPIDANEVSIRRLFGEQIGGGRVESVDFEDGKTKSNAAKAAEEGKDKSNKSKKRKRVTADELSAQLESHAIPTTFDTYPHPNGSTAVVTFVDRPSMESSLKAARKAAKHSTEIPWGGHGGDNKISTPFGLERYEAHKTNQYPPRDALLEMVNTYMSAYNAMEETRSKENASQRQMPDEDGFITVTRGSKGGVLRKEEADALKGTIKPSEPLQDFYRYQMREKRKEKQGEMLRKFEEDKRRVADMRARRGKLRPET